MEVVMRELTNAELDVVAAAGNYRHKKSSDLKVVIAHNYVKNYAGDNTGVLQQGLVNVNTGDVSHTGSISYGAVAPT
jgi:hypothetical protein